MHSRKSWFDLESRILNIPGKDTVAGANGKSSTWLPKDGEARSIPISQQFCDFLNSFLESKSDYCLPSKRSENGLYDFRLPYETFMANNGNKKFTTHAMRHSWISELCNSGNHQITEVSAWSGDTLETIQKNYWHKQTRTGGTDSTMSGKKAGHEISEMLKAIRSQVETNSEEDMNSILAEIAKLQALAIGLGAPKGPQTGVKVVRK